MFLTFILITSTLEVSYGKYLSEICFRNSVPKDSEEIVILHIFFGRKLPIKYPEVTKECMCIFPECNCTTQC